MTETDPDETPAGLTPRQLENMRHLRRTGYLQAVEQMAKRLSAPVWWDDPETGRVRGGSVCFVHTGSRLLGVTAAHIHTELVKLKQIHGELHCQMGGHTFEPEKRLLDINEKLDLATYALSELQTNAARADIHHAPEWPPLVDRKDVYLVCGWVSALAESTDDTVTSRFLHFITAISTSSPINLGFATYTSRSTPWGDTPLPAGTNLGGMSGGPVYRVSETGLSIMTLVGIVYEYQPAFEIAFARPLSLLNTDGTIQH